MEKAEELETEKEELKLEKEIFAAASTYKTLPILTKAYDDVLEAYNEMFKLADTLNNINNDQEKEFSDLLKAIHAIEKDAKTSPTSEGSSGVNCDKQLEIATTRITAITQLVRDKINALTPKAAATGGRRSFLPHEDVSYVSGNIRVSTGHKSRGSSKSSRSSRGSSRSSQSSRRSKNSHSSEAWSYGGGGVKFS